MTKPCIICGEPGSQSRCPDHRLADTRPNGHVHTNPARWKNLSKRLRKDSPFCETCGAVEQLQLDHIIPLSAAPELTYTAENCRVLCKTCNGRRQANWTTTEALAVLDRLQATYRRRPTRHGREHIAAAERAIADQGGSPEPAASPPEGKAQRALHTRLVQRSHPLRPQDETDNSEEEHRKCDDFSTTQVLQTREQCREETHDAYRQNGRQFDRAADLTDLDPLNLQQELADTEAGCKDGQDDCDVASHRGHSRSLP